MYRMLSGRHPFRITHTMYDHEVAMAVESKSHTALIEFGCCDAKVSNLVDRLLSKAPYQRPRSPAVLMDELNSIIGG